jgi:hypothetical protein
LELPPGIAIIIVVVVDGDDDAVDADDSAVMVKEICLSLGYMICYQTTHGGVSHRSRSRKSIAD